VLNRDDIFKNNKKMVPARQNSRVSREKPSLAALSWIDSAMKPRMETLMHTNKELILKQPWFKKNSPKGYEYFGIFRKQTISHYPCLSVLIRG